MWIENEVDMLGLGGILPSVFGLVFLDLRRWVLFGYASCWVVRGLNYSSGRLGVCVQRSWGGIWSGL